MQLFKKSVGTLNKKATFEVGPEKGIDGSAVQKRASFQVLKLIFDTAIFDTESAMAWASAHGFTVPEQIDTPENNEIILFQNSLGLFKPGSFVQNKITEGVSAIVGEMPEKQKQKELILNFSIKSAFEKKDHEDGPHTFTAFATTFGNEDLDGDVIMPGAVDEAIRKVLTEGKFPKILKDHDRTQRPAVMSSMVANDKGVLIEGRFLETQLGKDTFIEVKEGAISDMSIGFFMVENGFFRRDGKTFITDLNFKEVSFVTFPANEQANIISVKNSKHETHTTYSKPDNVRDFEKLLRDAGSFSKSEARTIASIGFKKASGRDALLQSIAENLKTKTIEMRK